MNVLWKNDIELSNIELDIRRKMNKEVENYKLKHSTYKTAT